MFPPPEKKKPKVSGETFTCLPLNYTYKRRLLIYMGITVSFMSECVMIDWNDCCGGEQHGMEERRAEVITFSKSPLETYDYSTTILVIGQLVKAFCKHWRMGREREGIVGMIIEYEFKDIYFVTIVTSWTYRRGFRKCSICQTLIN